MENAISCSAAVPFPLDWHCGGLDTEGFSRKSVSSKCWTIKYMSTGYFLVVTVKDEMIKSYNYNKKCLINLSLRLDFIVLPSSEATCPDSAESLWSSIFLVFKSRTAQLEPLSGGLPVHSLSCVGFLQVVWFNLLFTNLHAPGKVLSKLFFRVSGGGSSVTMQPVRKSEYFSCQWETPWF